MSRGSDLPFCDDGNYVERLRLCVVGIFHP